MAVIHHFDQQLGRFVELEIPDPEQARRERDAWVERQPCWAQQAPSVPLDAEDGQ